MIQPQAVPINFAQALDTKTDPKQIQMGKFLSLQNTVFQTGGLLKKRNGFGFIPALPDNTNTYLTTFNSDLTAIGSSINALSAGAKTWVSKGNISPMTVNTMPLLKNGANQLQCDSAISPNGLICTVYTENNGSTTSYKYVIADAATGQNIVQPTLIPVSSGTVTGSPRVFILGNYFILAFTNVISSVSHLQYISINSVNTSVITANHDIASAYISTPVLSWDAAVNAANNNIYFAYNTTTGGQSIKVTYLTLSAASLGLAPTSPVTFSGQKATTISVCIDQSNATSQVIYVSYYDSSASTAHTLAVSNSLATILSPTQTIASGSYLSITSAAQNGVCSVFLEALNNYSFDSSLPTNFIEAVTVTQSGTVGTPYVLLRSVGLASKAFVLNGSIYLLSTYQSRYQPTYFLVDASICTASNPYIVAKVAYENGGGPYAAGSAYLPLGLPSVYISDNTVQIPYLYKDLIESLNTLNNSTQTTTGGIYSQTGITLGSFEFGTQGLATVNIANDLHLSGGFLWMYDGFTKAYEHNFFLWPDMDQADAATWSDSGGSMAANPPGWVSGQPSYYYQVVYAYSDNQGNVFRSAPSIPISVTLSSDSSTTGSITLNIPTLRVTMKTQNPVVIEVYRWSVDEQNYYQVSGSSSQSNPILSPLLNNPSVDSVTFVDTYASSSIVGNQLIYTTGGVVEDVNGPASNIMTLFDTRLWLVDAEDQNLLWYSKQVIESVPVEMSDLFTLYIAPTSAAQGSTGPITAIAPMDDKLIIFKANAIYYTNGTGPDNTGANSTYSQPIFITSTVGCPNPNSIVFMPGGLLFQSENGIWLLGRGLETEYIGAPVEAFNSATVESAINVPATTQVRFTMSSGVTLMYDYYYGNWGTFVGIPALSSCIYGGLHSFINSSGQVYQETPGVYLDGDNPVLMSFTTGHIQLTGISGYQRIWEIQLLGQYYSPHLLNFQIGYDFGALSEQALITPINQTGVYGSDSIYGQTTPYGGPGALEQWRIQPSTELCQAFQISLTEVYDPSYGVPSGAGFTLSAMTCVIGVNRGYRPVKAATTAGTT